MKVPGHLQHLAVHPRELRVRVVVRGLSARRRVLHEVIMRRLADRLSDEVATTMNKC